MHNRSYVENQYLIHWSRLICPETRRYYYQNGRMTLMRDADWAARRVEQIKLYCETHPWLVRSPGFAAKLIDLRNALAYFLNYKTVPLLTCRILFRPPVNVYTGKIDREAAYNSSSSDKDHLLAYLENEISAYRSEGIVNINHIKHPMVECAPDVFRYLYGDIRECNVILIVPSYGYTARMIEAGWKSDDLVAHIAGKWCAAIDKLMEKFPNYEVRIKLHPGTADDPIWHKILAIITAHVPALRIIPASNSAEWQVVQSKVVVGDVTSVLWWAGMYDQKVVISLDIFGYFGGDELKEYPRCRLGI